MKLLISYSDESVLIGQKLCALTGKFIIGFDKIISYSPRFIEPSYYEKHSEILKMRKGNGLFLWKPYIVKLAMDLIEEGDILFYCDSGACFINSLKKIFEILKTEELWCCSLPLVEEQFTKTETFKKLGCLSDEYTKTNQIHASFFAIRKTQQTIQFTNDWLKYAEDIKILNSDNYDIPQKRDANFCDHRFDQSIFSLLCKQYGFRPMKDPSQFGKMPFLYYYKKNYVYKPLNFPKKYGISILHHRMHKFGLKGMIMSFLYCILPYNITAKIYIKRNQNKMPWLKEIKK